MTRIEQSRRSRGSGFNQYRIEKDVVYLTLKNRAGQVTGEALVDLIDLAMLEALGKRWCAKHSPDGGISAVRSGKVPDLHRLLTGAPEGLVVDHLNRNPLDNRRANLRVVTQAENATNRKLNVRNRTGVRGVRFDPEAVRRPYEVKLSVRTYRTRVTTLNIARITAVMARVQYWGVEAA
jgi:hypothetical protein